MTSQNRQKSNAKKTKTLITTIFTCKFFFRFLSSRVLPLGWWVKTEMTSRYGSSWPTDMCVNWYDADKNDMTWTNNLLHCPCSLDQALVDFGRWQQDHGCSLENRNNPNNCFYHKKAVHCVRAVQPV